MTQEALKLALEALYPISHNSTDDYRGQADKAITSLRKAIAELESQEPKCVVIIEVFGKDWRLEYMSLPVGKHKLYARQYLYTHPPQRTWQGLTDEEIEQLELTSATSTDVREIQAKLKEKKSWQLVITFFVVNAKLN